MTDEESASKTTKSIDKPLIFISHDSRDAGLAEAFSKLLKSVSAGMLKSFRSSDKKGTEGIQFGDDWYKRLMTKLDSASDVVCLLTERSVDRPWILYEAGVAKGKLETPVHGIALGVSLNRVGTGPFYQFQNSDDSEDSLTKLVMQLCERIPSLEPDEDVVKTQVQTFKETANEVLNQLKEPTSAKEQSSTDEGAVAKLLEEMKLMVRDLPDRIERRVIEEPERYRKRPFRKFHPMMIDEMVHMVSKRSDDPIGILFIASLVKDDFPWLYELGLDAYRAAKSGSGIELKEALRIFRDASEMTFHGPFIKEFSFISKEKYMMMREFPMVIEHYLHRYSKLKETPSNSSDEEQENGS
ncbi:MAG: toll/interleukin-1 receptor domain-containing protein [Pseudomonadota bacterium]